METKQSLSSFYLIGDGKGCVTTVELVASGFRKALLV
jgi:hypothetical protein